MRSALSKFIHQARNSHLAIALLASCLVNVAAASDDVELYDSGWATSDGTEIDALAPPESLISPRGVPVERLLPSGSLDKLKVTAKTPKPAAARTKQPSERQPTKAPQASPAQPVVPKAKATGPAKAEPKTEPPRTRDDITNAFALPGKPVEAAPPEMRADKAPASGSSARREASDSPSASVAPREPALFPGLAEDSTPAPLDPAPLDAAPIEPSSKPETQPAEPRIATAKPRRPLVKPVPAKPLPSEPSEGEEDRVPELGSASESPALQPKLPTQSPEPKPTKRQSKPADLPAKKEPASEAPERDEQADDEPAEESSNDAAIDRDSPVRKTPAIGIYGALQPASPDQLKPLSRSQQYLQRRLRSVLSYYYRRPLNNRDHDPWEVMHGMIAYGLHSRILDATNRSKPVTAIGYLCFNKPCKNKRLLHLTPDGEIDADVAYGVQGHRGQFLAMLAQCNVSPDYPVRIEDKKFTIHDLIEYEKRTCYSETELTFKLIALAHYLDLDETWTSDDGEQWSVSRLIAEERNQKIRGAACGGTHRLSGLALAARLRVARGEPLDGEFAEAQRFTEQQQAYALRLQNRDGSLSTEWFRGPGDEEDINRRVRTTGHILEWLLYSLPEERLTDPQVVRTVNYLTSLLASNTDNAWEIGPLSHALHALMLYDERVFQPHDKPTQVAAKSNRNGNAGQRTVQPRTLAYQSINSRVYGTYLSSEEAEEAREEAANKGGLRALFGIGRSNSRRSR